MDIKIIDEQRKNDINIPNQPFGLFGRMKPTFADGRWSYTTEQFESVSEMCFPDENYDFDKMSKDNTFIGAHDGDERVGLAVMQEGFFRYAFSARTDFRTRKRKYRAPTR